MNLFGEIGNFIIKYQELIQAAAIVCGIILVVTLIIKMCRHARRKQEILQDISDTVYDIHETVKQLKEKSTEMVYVDQRSCGDRGETTILPVPAAPATTPESTPEPAQEPVTAPAIAPEPEPEPEPVKLQEAEPVMPVEESFSEGLSVKTIEEMLEKLAEKTSEMANLEFMGEEDADFAQEEPKDKQETEEEIKNFAEEVIEPPLKYFDRNCAVSKTGRKFTYEELDAQIKA